MAPHTLCCLHVKGDLVGCDGQDRGLQSAQPKDFELPGREPHEEVAPSMVQPPARLTFGDWKKKCVLGYSGVCQL
jgi:hypothetical protein